MKIYRDAPDEVAARLLAIEKRHHPRLVQHEVTIDLRMVEENTEVPMPCLKHQGYPAIAIVSVTPLKRRAQGGSDALIEIDRVSWEKLSEAEQDAVLDHELTHLKLQTDKNGVLQRDGLGRPKLRIRLHDHQLGWFNEVAQRRKAASQEVQQYARLLANVHQQWFPWAQEFVAKQKKRHARDDQERELIGDVRHEPDHRGILAGGKPSRNGAAKTRAATTSRRPS